MGEAYTLDITKNYISIKTNIQYTIEIKKRTQSIRQEAQSTFGRTKRYNKFKKKTIKFQLETEGPMTGLV